MKRSRAAALLLGLAMVAAAPAAAARAVLLQSTTSTQNSGLYDHLLPIFAARSGIEVRVVAVGTGQALRNARNCDGDLVIAHAPAAEEAFVAAGYGLARHALMRNDFVLVGPRADPAGVGGLSDGAGALAAIAAAQAPFASRGDDSGTHAKEQALWRAAGLSPADGSGRWYLETGSGMGATLNVAAGLGAYALTDRATWRAFGNKADLTALLDGDPALANLYSVIAVNPARCPLANAEGAQIFIDWLLSGDGQAAIGAFALDGAPLFTPAAE